MVFCGGAATRKKSAVNVTAEKNAAYVSAPERVLPANTAGAMASPDANTGLWVVIPCIKDHFFLLSVVIRIISDHGDGLAYIIGSTCFIVCSSENAVEPPPAPASALGGGSEPCQRCG